MNNAFDGAIAKSEASVLQTNTVLRQTYMLLSMTLLFSAVMAGVAMMLQLPPLNMWLVLGGYFGLLFATHKTSRSAAGLFFVFALTGFMGFTLGPILNLYMGAYANGGELVMLALGGTGAIFLGLSAYALNTKKDFSFMGGFLAAGIMVAFIAALGAMFFQIPGLSLAVSAVFMLLMCGLILYETSSIIHGGETNYILATVTLYVSIYNLFTSLLHLLGVFGGED